MNGRSPPDPENPSGTSVAVAGPHPGTVWVNDEVIAAITLYNDGEIITRGRHFGKILGLTVTRY